MCVCDRRGERKKPPSKVEACPRECNSLTSPRAAVRGTVTVVRRPPCAARTTNVLLIAQRQDRKRRVDRQVRESRMQKKKGMYDKGGKMTVPSVALRLQSLHICRLLLAIINRSSRFVSVIPSFFPLALFFTSCFRLSRTTYTHLSFSLSLSSEEPHHRSLRGLCLALAPTSLLLRFLSLRVSRSVCLSGSACISVALANLSYARSICTWTSA